MTLAFTETDRYLSAMPLYFGGSRAYAMSNLFCGATVVMLPPPYKPQDIVEAVRAHRITTSFLVPTMLRRLLEIAPADRPLLEGLRVLLCTGSVLHPDERREVLARISPALCNYYGSTEGGGATLLRPEVEGEAAASVGRAVLGVEVEVVGEDQRPLPAGEEGRIRYRGPSVPERGYKDTDGGERAFRDGWYYPGDLGRLDEAGYLYVTGRAKDMIIRGGANIYPVEIEQVLLANEAVRDAAVVGWPSQEYGEEIAAFVIKQADTDEAELIAYCRSRLAPYKLPRGIFFVDDFPKTGPGKIHKKKLAEGLPKL
jgi:acyl-CoA synthetase (AMP-forming)/AMP-acid ligase II